MTENHKDAPAEIDSAGASARSSFSHFVALLKFEEPVQRAFYEIECIQSNRVKNMPWSQSLNSPKAIRGRVNVFILTHDMKLYKNEYLSNSNSF